MRVVISGPMSGDGVFTIEAGGAKYFSGFSYDVSDERAEQIKQALEVFNEKSKAGEDRKGDGGV